MCKHFSLRLPLIWAAIVAFSGLTFVFFFLFLFFYCFSLYIFSGNNLDYQIFPFSTRPTTVNVVTKGGGKRGEAGRRGQRRQRCLCIILFVCICMHGPVRYCSIGMRYKHYTLRYNHSLTHTNAHIGARELRIFVYPPRT